MTYHQLLAERSTIVHNMAAAPTTRDREIWVPLYRMISEQIKELWRQPQSNESTLV